MAKTATRPGGGQESAVDDDGWMEVRGSGGRLLCRIDAGRLLLEVKPKGGAVELVDLRPILRGRWLEVCKSCIDLEGRPL